MLPRFYVLGIIVAAAQSSLIDFSRLPDRCPPRGGTLDITADIGGSYQLRGGEIFFRDEFRAREARDLLCTAFVGRNGTDSLGSYSERNYTWTDNSSVQWVTSIRQYQHLDLVVFTQAFPNGVRNAATGDVDSVISGFPSFLMNPANDSGAPLFIHFSGYMAGHYPQYGTWSDGTGGIWLAGGMQNSGVIAIFDNTSGLTVVVSPFSHFMSASLTVERSAAGACVHWGIMGNVSSLPSGHEQSFVLHAKRSGVNGGVKSWGRLMRQWFGKGDQADARARDVTLQNIGYSTDNGAYYYFYTGESANYEDLIGRIKKYAVAANIPYKHIQFDSWWYYRAEGIDKSGNVLWGVINWTARPSIFPKGLPFIFQNITGWPVMAHNRYWATNNVYASNPETPIGPSRYHGAVFPFFWGAEAGLPQNASFWDNLFSINSDWGLAVYEQDWLCTTVEHMPVLTQDANMGAKWLRDMGEGAERHGLSIQYCMSYPRHVLQSLEVPTVTQARASNDYQPQTQIFDYNQWKIAESSLWVAAIGICPSKDSFWTMPTSQYDPHYDPIWNCSEKRNRLESVSASMSNGVVQISDRIGYSNRSLIMQSCTESGRILTPDFSATPSDGCIASRAIAASRILSSPAMPCGAHTGAIHGATSLVQSAGQFFYILSVGLVEPYEMHSHEWCRSWGSSENGTCVGSEQWIAFEANATTQLFFVGGTRPLPLLPSDEYSFQYFTLAPVPPAARDGDWVFLGEDAKWISASQVRVKNVTSSTGGATAVLEGAPGEQVIVRFAQFPTLASFRVSCGVCSSGLVAAGVTPLGNATCLCQ